MTSTATTVNALLYRLLNRFKRSQPAMPVLELGGGVDELTKRLRIDLIFDKRRASTIARTESATALGQANLQSYQSLGHEGKRWLTAGDERVDAGNPSGPCISNEGQGPVRLGKPFNSGHDTIPAHQNCRCTLTPVREMPRGSQRVRRTVERDDDGRISAVVEETIDVAA